MNPHLVAPSDPDRTPMADKPWSPACPTFADRP